MTYRPYFAFLQLRVLIFIAVITPVFSDNHTTVISGEVCDVQSVYSYMCSIDSGVQVNDSEPASLILRFHDVHVPSTNHNIPILDSSDEWSTNIVYIYVHNIPYTKSKLSRYVRMDVPHAQYLDLTDVPKVKLHVDPDLGINLHLLGVSMNAEHSSVSWLRKLRVEMEDILSETKMKSCQMLNWTITSELEIINRQLSVHVNVTGETPSVKRLQQEKAEFMKFQKLLDSGDYDGLYNALKGKLENITKEAEKIEFILTVLHVKQLSPKELADTMAKATEQQQRVAQQAQIEKIERLQQIKEEGAPVLRRTKHETEDERQEEIRLLLALLVLWFLLCYCSDGTIWCVDIELTFGLSLVLSEIILLLGGDIEKNPGPLSGIHAYSHSTL